MSWGSEMDIRELIASAVFKRIDQAVTWDFGHEGEERSPKSVTEGDIADAVLAALTEAGLVVVPAEAAEQGATAIEYLAIQQGGLRAEDEEAKNALRATLPLAED